MTIVQKFTGYKLMSKSIPLQDHTAINVRKYHSSANLYWWT